MFVWNHRRMGGPLLLLLTALLVAGCKDGEAVRNLKRVSDEASLQRLEAMPAGAAALFSLHGGAGLQELPALGANARRLGSSGNSWLVVASREEAATLAGTPQLDRLVVWGGEAAVGKLDSRLRQAMLTHLAHADGAEKPLAVVARFENKDAALRPGLQELGAAVGSENAGIVTLEAPVSVLLKILDRDDLIELTQPVMQQPLRSARQ
jgi:hypothetical protein